METAERKKALRSRILLERAAMSAEERERRSQLACGHLLRFPPLLNSRSVLAFYPTDHEIDIRPFVREAARRGQVVLLPVSERQENRFAPYVYNGEASLRRGAFGIWEPDPALAPKGNAADIDTVLVPGVAFDSCGGRVGYGGGYYDRFLSGLAHKPLLIGLCFSLQLQPQVPMEPHDWRVDCIVTENGVIGPCRPKEN